MRDVAIFRTEHGLNPGVSPRGFFQQPANMGLGRGIVRDAQFPARVNLQAQAVEEFAQVLFRCVVGGYDHADERAGLGYQGGSVLFEHGAESGRDAVVPGPARVGILVAAPDDVRRYRRRGAAAQRCRQVPTETRDFRARFLEAVETKSSQQRPADKRRDHAVEQHRAEHRHGPAMLVAPVQMHPPCERE